MTRVKRGTIANKKRTRILKAVKGFRWGRKSKEVAAKEALTHAWQHAFRGRKEKKRNFRSLWNTKINAALRTEGLTYSRFISLLKKENISLDRKVLADIAENRESTWKEIISAVKK